MNVRFMDIKKFNSIINNIGFLIIRLSRVRFGCPLSKKKQNYKSILIKYFF